jgi:hypothetical protein
MTKLLLLTTMMFPMQSQAISQQNEINCLKNIIYSESRGESLEGIVALGQATIARSKRTGLSICRINGVTRKRPPERMSSYWNGIAKNILADRQKSIVGHADSWNTGTKPYMSGKVERVIQSHVFYVANGELK